MNKEILNELISRYEASMPVIYNNRHDELFKWNALKTFQEEWFASAEKYPDFISRFSAATKDFSIFIDNSRMHPRNGVVKLYAKNPAEVERLFVDVLFSSDGGDLNLRQQHMDEFLEGMDKLRMEYYPANWSYKQDRHSASTYLAMYAPAENYVYKFSEAESMAVYGEFGFNIGSGADFNLAYYYKMCDEIVEALKQHPTVCEAHFSHLRDKHYREESLHLLAFDLIYCCRTYNYYNGIAHRPKKESIKKAAEDAKQQAKQQTKQQELDMMYEQLKALELSCPDVSDISLVNVEVESKVYGIGIVAVQDLNKIKVKFADTEKTFILDPKYPVRPTFENDTEVVAAFGEYLKIQEQIKSLRKKIAAAEEKI